MNRNVNRFALSALILGVGGVMSAGAMAQESSSEQACELDQYAMGLRYHQQSAEVAALQRQGYALATYRLKDRLAERDDETPLAIITDLDETVIDNSALLVRDMQACHDFTSWDTWKHWEREGEPRLIPGAKEFLEFADEQDVAIFYVSDRYEENKAATLDTLNALALPQVSDEHVLLLGPPKSERRQQVTDDYTLVMQLGDTLHDFSELFTSELDEQRRQVEENAERFGDDWIMFPNATYGSWSDAELDAWQAPFEEQ
ncbi:5'-nucleotidase, lipoprotein e(P4) family [Halomonas sp. HNIBRBA4712]|uniref:5'-nucleotidase, lipoprotein e(P4) family n=1 Tax=Halomonas sp. HNIBRBA4712 TaxID=3373087 RepID=UPI003744C3E8